MTVELPSGTAVVEGELSEEVSGPNAKMMLAIWDAQRHQGAIIDVNKPGPYRTEGLPAGQYGLFNAIALYSGGQPIAEVELKEGQTVKLNIDAKTLEPTKGGGGQAAVIQTLAVSDQGIPLPGTQMYLTGPAGQILASIAADNGSFFSGEAGEYTLHASYPGHAPATRKVTLVNLSELTVAKNLALIQLQRQK
jgi:hypothetical protein